METMKNVIELLIPILLLVYIGLNCYNKTKVELLTYVSELIAMAEKTGLTGPEKMNQVVAKLYEKVPKWLKRFFDEKQLQILAQWVFDWMRKYADAYVKDETLEDKIDKQTDAVIVDAVSEILVSLLNETEEKLRKMAAEKGIDLTGKNTKEEIVRELVISILRTA